MKSIVVPVRLSSATVQQLDKDVEEGRAENRSDALRKAALAYYSRGCGQ